MDLTYSILKQAGIDILPAFRLEGIDLLGHVMEGKADFDRELFWRRKRGNTTAKAVRSGQWKYIHDDRNESHPHQYSNPHTHTQTQTQTHTLFPSSYQSVGHDDWFLKKSRSLA
jgi:hypothetical protein